MKRIDRTGQQFGNILILKELGGGKVLGRCLLCGKEKEFIKSNVVGGLTTSCGCQHPGKRKDITGMRFGRLVAIRPIGKKPGKSMNWECKCDCGNTCVVNLDSLTSGDRTSCGCKETESRTRLIDKKHYQGTNVETIRSTKANVNNKLGVRGVYLKKNRYVAYISFKGQQITLGSFVTLEEAKKARARAEEKYFKPILEEAYEEGVIDSLEPKKK